MKLYHMKISALFDERNKFYYKRSMTKAMIDFLAMYNYYHWPEDFEYIYASFIADKDSKILCIQMYEQYASGTWESRGTYTRQNWRKRGLAKKVWKHSLKKNNGKQPEYTVVISKQGLALVNSLKIKDVSIEI